MATILGRKVGLTGYGLMGLTWRPVPCSEEQAFAAMKAALESGANLWNGAEFYGPPDNNSLHLLNRYFTRYPEDAEKVVLIVKGGGDPVKLVPDGTEKGIRRSVDQCLKLLDGKKKMDVFACARVDPNVPVEESIKVLAEYVKEGKIGGISLSEVKASTIRRAHAVHPIVSVEVEMSLWSTEPLYNEVIETCAELGIAVIAYSPIGRGMLSGEFKSPADLPEGDIRQRMPRFQPDTFPKNLELVEKVKEVARTKGVTPAQLAIAWVKAQGKVAKQGRPDVIPIPGATTAARVLENGKEVVLTLEEEAAIEKILESSEIAGGRYPVGEDAFLQL